MGLLRLLCNGQVEVIEGGECGEKDFRCAALRPVSGVGSVTTNRKVFRTILAASPVVETREECRLGKEECGGMTGMECEYWRFKIVVK